MAIVYFGGELQDERIFRFKKPGAYHRARFMQNELYIFKYVMLDQQINWLNQNQRQKLKKMAVFIALFQAKDFLQVDFPSLHQLSIASTSLICSGIANFTVQQRMPPFSRVTGIFET